VAQGLEEQISQHLGQLSRMLPTIPGIGKGLDDVILNEVGDTQKFAAPGK
jgi:hypothetical protein